MMNNLRKFFMEDFLEFNRNIKYNLAESGMLPRTLNDILSVLRPEALDEMRAISFADSPNWGRDDLRELVSGIHQGSNPANVLITTGTSEAIFLLFRQLKPKKIALIFPAYQLLYELPMQQKSELINLPIYWDKSGSPYFDESEWVDLLKTHRPDVILINNPHNPSGLLLSDEVLRKIVATAQEIDATIVGDEHYRFLASETELLGPTLYNPRHKVFVTGSYMKCLGMSGIRIGWCVGSSAVLSAMQNEKNYITHVVSPLTEWLSVQILSEARETLFNQARSEWLSNKSTYQEFLREFPSICSSVPQGGLVTCIGFNGITTAEKRDHFLNQCIENGIFMLPLSSMEMGVYQTTNTLPKELIFGFRLGLGLKPNDFKESLNILSDVISKQL